MSTDAHDATLAQHGAESEARPVIGARYEILGLLGAGGMGNVYKAKDLELDELVALKVLKPELVGAPGALERFRREVKLARRVTHPNVARVFDIGELGGDKILTMELVDGEPLSALLERERVLSTARAIEIASAICAGVGAAHAAGVVHRDLKPDNVLLARDGRVVVTDFGIARAAVNTASTQTLGGIVGTPAYMAPEQVEGSKEIDERADVYAFGAMLFELLTGERAWKGESPIAVAAARLIKPPPDPRSVAPVIGQRLAAIILRAMARDPADRYATMADVASELATVTTPGMGLSAPNHRTAYEPAGLERGSSDKRVAVLPFQNLGPADQDYVADGLTEDLIDLLSVAKGLRVCSRGIVMRFKENDRDPREIGRLLDVQVVVEGSVRKTPRGVRVSSRLISVADGFQLWAKRFEDSEQNLFVLNDEVARSVAEALTVDIGSTKREASDPEAVDLYLRARAAAHRFFSRASPNQPIPMFEKALARAPDDPRVIAGYVMACARDPDTAKVSLDKLQADAERALTLAPSLPDAHVALGVVLFHARDEAQAIRPLRNALRLASNHAEAHDLLGRILTEVDRDEGRRHLEAAIAQEPSFEIARMALARHYFLRDQTPERAYAMFEGSAAFTPALSRFVIWQRDVVAAEAMLKKLEGMEHVPRGMKLMLEVVAKGTVPDESFFSDHSSSGRRTRAFFKQLEAEITIVAGEEEKCLAAIEAGEALGLIDLAWCDRCPLFAELRAHPRFVVARNRVAERAGRIVAAYLAPD